MHLSIHFQIYILSTDNKNTFTLSFTQNRVKALKVLRARLFEIKRKEVEEKRTKERNQQIGTGERHERIRTYNFPQVQV